MQQTFKGMHTHGDAMVGDTDVIDTFEVLLPGVASGYFGASDNRDARCCCYFGVVMMPGAAAILAW